jgi:hypothetical protein
MNGHQGNNGVHKWPYANDLYTNRPGNIISLSVSELSSSIIPERSHTWSPDSLIQIKIQIMFIAVLYDQYIILEENTINV